MAEILAPVGGAEQLIAAVRCGADAVYLGTGGFNARRNAENFSSENLGEVVGFCHARGVKVYVTVNTLIMDSEMSDLEHEIELIAKSGADAVIIQDLAVMALFRDRCPEIKRHASTQMVVHDVEGARLMQELGFERVVLARELSFKEIEKIISSVDIECEVFVHGAHCMSVSGACYVSAMLGGRSGNRGLCAQPCRTDFRINGRNYALSLKDMSYISRLRELDRIGVASMKIEGRMKRPEYVAAVVTACRDSLAGREYDIDSVRSVFSRSGFTQGYLDAKRDGTMFGIRTREDVEASKNVLGKIAGLYRGERQSVPVSMKLVLGYDSSSLTVKCEGVSVAVSGDIPEPAISRPTDSENAMKSLGRTGGTPFLLEHLTVSNEKGLALAPSALNAMRRDALDKLLSIRSAPKPHKYIPGAYNLKGDYTPPSAPVLRARFESVGQITCADKLDKMILPLGEINEAVVSLYKDRLIAEFPPLAFPDNEEKVRAEGERVYALGVHDALVGNAYSLRMAKSIGYTLHGGFGLNIMNTVALSEYEKLSLSDAVISFELALSRIKKLGGTIPRGIIGYGYLPLMRFRSCPARGENGCGECKGRPVLKDSGNVAFQMICTGRRYSTMLNSVPLIISDRDLSGLDFVELYFTTEAQNECGEIINAYENCDKTDRTHTGGLYFRSIQ